MYKNGCRSSGLNSCIRYQNSKIVAMQLIANKIEYNTVQLKLEKNDSIVSFFPFFFSFLISMYRNRLIKCFKRTSYEQVCQLTTQLASVPDFFTYRFDSIRFGQKIEMTRRMGASTRHLIQMSHFITTGVMKQAKLLSLFQKKQESIFLSKACYYVKFL